MGLNLMIHRLFLATTMLVISAVAAAASPPSWTESNIDSVDISAAQPAIYIGAETGRGFARISLDPTLDAPLIWREHGSGYVAVLTVCCNFQNLPFQSRWLLTIDAEFAAAISEIRIHGLMDTLNNQPINTVTTNPSTWPPSGLWSPTLSTPNPGTPATLILYADEIPGAGEMLIRSRNVFEGLSNLGDLCMESATCEIDRQQGARLTEYANYSRSVALLRFYASQEDVWATCTGTLIRDAQLSGRKFMLTASHCIRDQGYADSLEFVWFFTEQPSQRCTGLASDQPLTVTVGGADILTSQDDESLDWVLLEIRGAIPEQAHFMDWDISPVVEGEEVFTFGHSRAGIQSFATGVTGAADSGDLSEYRRTDFTSLGILPGASGAAVVSIDGSKIRIAALAETAARGGSVLLDCPLGTVEVGKSVFGVTMPAVYTAASQWLDPQGLRSSQVSPPPPPAPPAPASGGGGGTSGLLFVCALALLTFIRRRGHL